MKDPMTPLTLGPLTFTALDDPKYDWIVVRIMPVGDRWWRRARIQFTRPEWSALSLAIRETEDLRRQVAELSARLAELTRSER